MRGFDVLRTAHRNVQHKKIPLVFRILQVTETCWYSGQWTCREGCQRCFKSSEDQHPVTVHRLPTYHRTMCKKVVVRYLVTANRKQTACSAAYFGMLDVGPIGKGVVRKWCSAAYGLGIVPHPSLFLGWRRTTRVYFLPGIPNSGSHPPSSVRISPHQRSPLSRIDSKPAA